MVLRIEDIRKPDKVKRNRKRKGRGMGSGRGKTCGRGQKGAKSRSGGGKYTPGFEGGQMPLIRRIPKRGFTNKFRKKWSIVNVGSLEDCEGIKDGSVVDKDLLLKHRLLRNARLPFKVLCKGELKKNVTVKANAFSAAAKQEIEKAGGKAETV